MGRFLPKIERLESRLLFARSTDILFDFEFDFTFSDSDDSLSDVYVVNDLYVAWTNNSAKDEGQYEVIDPQSGERWSVPDIPSQRPEQVVLLDDTLFLFFARVGSHVGNLGIGNGVGQEVWTTDGRTATLLADISDVGFVSDASFVGSTLPFYSFVVGDKIYFPADDELSSSSDFEPPQFNDYAVWQTDGTPGGTTQTELTIQIDEALVHNDTLYFIANDEEGSAVYAASEAIEDAQELGRFEFPMRTRATNSTFDPQLVAYGDRVYFRADDGNGMRLWSTDGMSDPIVSVLPNQDRRDAMPGEILYDSEDLTISAKHQRGFTESSVCLPRLPCSPVRRFLVDLWIWRDGDSAPQFLTEIEDAPDFLLGLDFDSPDFMRAQVIEDQIFFRMLSSREQGNQMRFLMHSIDLPQGAAGHVPGDIDCDGSVGFADFLELSNSFGQVVDDRGQIVDAVWTDGDFNGDGLVDFADFLSLAANFGIGETTG